MTDKKLTEEEQETLEVETQLVEVELDIKIPQVDNPEVIRARKQAHQAKIRGGK